MKKQVILIKWWEAKENYEDYYDFLEKQDFNPYKIEEKRWNRNLWEVLWNEYEVLTLSLPNRYFADYKAWKIMFEKTFKFIIEGSILVGHSMWGVFLAKYFDEEDISNIIAKIKKIILVAPPFKDDNTEVIWSFNFKNKKLEKLNNISEKITIFWSKDDFVVPFEDIQDYMNTLSRVEFKISENMWHYLIEEFPELIEEIKN